MKPSMIMLVGIPGSGKSTYANKLAKEINAIVLSSDSLREEMFGDVNDQGHNEEVFKELHARSKNLLSTLNNIIYDATNIKIKNRQSYLNELKGIDCYKKCIVFATPYELCLQNNSQRDRVVPESVIKRMRESFHFPLYNEGFDEIEFIWNMGDMKFSVNKLLKEAVEFDQHNRHHSLTLGEHMWAAACQLPILGYNDLLFPAARLHDIGKMETQVFADRNGNSADEARYYNHQYVGAYNAMFYLKQHQSPSFSDEEILHICTLIQYHMHPYIAWKDSEKAKNRYQKLLGQELFDEIMILHEADVAAH